MLLCPKVENWDKDLPELLGGEEGGICATVMRKPEDFLSAVKWCLYLIFFSTVALQKDFVSLNNLLLSKAHVFKSSHSS